MPSDTWKPWAQTLGLPELRGPVPCQGKGLRGDLGAVLFMPSGGSHVRPWEVPHGVPAPSVETSRVTLLAAAGSGPFSEMTRGR